MRNLCLSGGVALNCVANGKIEELKLFDKIYIQPLLVTLEDLGMTISNKSYIFSTKKILF